MKYYIAFERNDDEGTLKALTVEIGTELILDENMLVAIDLINDPNYRDLVKYIKDNPPRERKLHS